MSPSVTLIDSWQMLPAESKSPWRERSSLSCRSPFPAQWLEGACLHHRATAVEAWHLLWLHRSPPPLHSAAAPQLAASTMRRRWITRSRTAMSRGPPRAPSARKPSSAPCAWMAGRRSPSPARFPDVRRDTRMWMASSTTLRMVTEHRFVSANHSNVGVGRVTRQLRACGTTQSISIPRCRLRLSGRCSNNMLVITVPRNPHQQLLILKTATFFQGKHSATL